MAKKQELAVIDFTQFSVAQLPELKGKKEEIASIIEANPIVEIVDNATYESAKKSRTAVKTLRTGLEKEQKDVKKKIKEHVLDVVDREYDTLVLGVKTAEQSRQEPIDVWEEKKEQERQEKARLEQERIDGIKAKIKFFSDSWTENINNLKFSEIAEVSKLFGSVVDLFDKKSLEEFDVLFDREASNLAQLMQNKISTLQEQEQIRIDNLLIQEKNAENTRIQEWQRVWNANIDSLSFSDITDVKSVLVKSKLADLKHYVSGYEEIYLSTEKRLHSQIEFVSKAEEQRIAQEKLEQDKKKFEEQQAEAKFQERCKRLTEAGSVYSEQKNGFEKQGHWYHCDDIRNDSNEMFERELEDAKNTIEEVEVVAEEVVRVPNVDELVSLSKEIGGNYTELKIAGIKKTDKSDEIVNNDVQEVEFEPISFDLLKAETWDDVRDAFEKENFDNIENGFSEQHSAMKSLIFNWLKENYNVPIKK